MSFFARTLRLLVVLAVVLSTQGMLLVQTMYVLRKDYVARVLCENRDRPELHCEGKCQLHKQHDEQADRQARAKATLEVLMAFSLHVPDAVVLPAPEVAPRTFAPGERSTLQEGVAPGIDRPPSA